MTNKYIPDDFWIILDHWRINNDINSHEQKTFRQCL